MIVKPSDEKQGDVVGGVAGVLRCNPFFTVIGRVMQLHPHRLNRTEQFLSVSSFPLRFLATWRFIFFAQRRDFYVVTVLSLGYLLAACVSMPPTALPSTPTWSYSAPTLAASPAVFIYPPTEIPPDFVSAGQSDPTAAALPWNSSLPPFVVSDEADWQVVEIVLRDGTRLSGNLYADLTVPELQRRFPGVLLIGSAPEVWGGFLLQLRDAGFTVLALDMGDRDTAADLSDVLRAFSGAGTVSPGLLAVIGNDTALIGCAAEALCDAVVLLDPADRESLLTALAQYNPRPLLLIAGSADTTTSATVSALQVAATGETTVLFPENAAPGAELLVDPEVSLAVIQWLQHILVE